MTESKSCECGYNNIKSSNILIAKDMKFLTENIEELIEEVHNYGRRRKPPTQFEEQPQYIEEPQYEEEEEEQIVYYEKPNKYSNIRFR